MKYGHFKTVSHTASKQQDKAPFVLVYVGMIPAWLGTNMTTYLNSIDRKDLVAQMSGNETDQHINFYSRFTSKQLHREQQLLDLQDIVLGDRLSSWS